MIVPALYQRQRTRGFLTEADLRAVAEQLGEPLYRVQQVVSFFPHFRTKPPPAVEVLVCRDLSCQLRGSRDICRALQARASAADSPTGVHVREVSCLGRCDRAPAVLINEQLFVSRTADNLREAVEAFARGGSLPADRDQDTADKFSPAWQIDPYPGAPTYSAVEQYLRDPQPEHVIKALETAGLLGMGGAGGRTYLKWSDVLQAEGSPKYVVCNGDESEPGTFKDRDILLAKPHLVVEGMILGGLVTGAERGFVYIRHEYHEQIERLEATIGEAYRRGVCGPSVLGSGRRFDLEVFVSPGGYICGEQTALIEAIESKRAEPRNRPPELQTNGLFDKPTLLSNVETFAWVPAILLRGLEGGDNAAVPPSSQGSAPSEWGKWFRQAGRKAAGRRMFSIAGDLARPGVYEVPCGILLGELIDDYCGGMRDGLALQAVALSGPSGGFLPANVPASAFKAEGLAKYLPGSGSMIDVRKLPLDVAASRAIGFMLGAGLTIYAVDADMLAQTIATSEFYKSESCGKCVPCRIGSQKIYDLALRIGSSKPMAAAELQASRMVVNLLGGTMETTSICGLGQVASNALRSYLRYFASDVSRDLDATR